MEISPSTDSIRYWIATKLEHTTSISLSVYEPVYTQSPCGELYPEAVGGRPIAPAGSPFLTERVGLGLDGKLARFEVRGQT